MGRSPFGNVRHLSSGRWQARYWNGLGARVNAPETFATKADAQRWLARVLGEQLSGTYADPIAGRLFFAELADVWLVSKPEKRRASLARDRAALRTHFNPAVGQFPLTAITAAHVRGMVDAMRERGLQPKSIRTYMGTLSAIFNAAVETDLIPRSPVRGVHLERSPRRKRPTMTTSELYALVGETPPRFRALVFTACVLGLRWSEVIALRVSDVNFFTRTITVAQTIEEVHGHVRVVEATKSEASNRTMAVPQSVIGALAHHLASFRRDIGQDDLIFIGARGGILRRHFLARVLKPAAQRAGLPVGRRQGLDFHGLRHIAATMMVTTGEHPRVMQSRLGHATPMLTLGLYAHVPNELDRETATRLEALLTKNDDKAFDEQDALGTPRAQTEE